MNPFENLWEILKHEMHSELITKIKLTENSIKVWFYSEKIAKFHKTFIENMPSWIIAFKASKGIQTRC